MNKLLLDLRRSILNSTNFNGFGAVLFSIGLGSLIGAGLFFTAVVLGTVNKYLSIQSGWEEKANASGNILIKVVNDPTVTAKVLMLATTYNFAAAMYSAYLTQGAEQLGHIFMGIGWMMGVFGDNALRRLDKLNFTSHVDLNRNMSGVMQAFRAVVSNPVIFYNATVMCFAVSMLLGDDVGMAEKITGLLTIGIAGGSFVYAGYKAVSVVKRGLAIEKINDGVTNIVSVVVTIAFGSLGIAAGNYWVFISQLLFAASSLKALFETRNALAKQLV